LTDGVSHEVVESLELGVTKAVASRAGWMRGGEKGGGEEWADGAKEVSDTTDLGALTDEEELDGRLVESTECCMQILDLVGLLHKLRSGVAHLDSKELDATAPILDSARLSCVWRWSADGGWEAEGGLGGAALKTDSGADDVECGQPEVTIDETGPDK
jgi:hypothetical protein